MSPLWICLSLFYGASFLKSSASSSTSVTKPGVALKCNGTVGEVEAGKDVTLYCVIYLELLGSLEDCMVTAYEWNNTSGTISCNADQYTCKCDNQTVSLTISGVNKNESYNVSVETGCGATTSPAINVRVKPAPFVAKSSENPKDPEPTNIVTPVALGIFVTLVVFGMCFLAFRYIRRKQTQPLPL